jgi:hypothetical protein
MSILRALGRAFGVKYMVEIAGKDLSNLDGCEVAEMIRVHLGDRGLRFHKDAIYEFIHEPSPDPDLEKIRRRIVEIDDRNRTPIDPDGLGTVAGMSMLRALAEELEAKGHR